MNAAWLLTGSPAPLPERLPLRAGPLSLAFEAGDLRYVTFGDREVVRRIYGAVRDRNWGTVPGRISSREARIDPQSFHLTYVSEHREREIDFLWRATISGDADGTLRFEFDGEARSTFLRNRIGLCVLHPIRECAGVGVRAHVGSTDGDGRVSELVFPVDVAAEQPVRGFTRLTGLDHEVRPGTWAELRFEGDLFETEDQRNWLDASFKTFCTPLSEPFPVEVAAGTRIRQALVLRVREMSGPAKPAPAISTTSRLPLPRASTHDAPWPLELHTDRGRDAVPLPSLGLGAASHGRPLQPAEVETLTRLQVAHLRHDLRRAEPGWRSSLGVSVRDTMELGAALELAVHLTRDEPADLMDVRRELGRLKTDLVRILVFRDGTRSTRAADLAAARLAFADFGIPLGAGTNADLCQFNLEPPDREPEPDLLCWSMNPQVHASDLASIAETPEAALHQLRSVQRAWPGVPRVVSPVTLKPRFNPVATGPEPEPEPGELPPQVDPRQLSLFAAGWTLAMVQALAVGGAESATFFESTGWRGVLAGATDSPLPERFPARAGLVFPIYHVLADLAELAGASVRPLIPPDPLEVTGLLLERASHRVLLVANLGPASLRLVCPEIQSAGRTRLLDLASAPEALADPGRFRRSSSSAPATDPGRGVELELPPFAYACWRSLGPCR